MRSLVTGAGGFVGSFLVPYLRDQGDEVYGLGPGLDVDVDVLDGAAVDAAVADTRPNAVYHLAGRSHVGDSWDAPQQVFRVNAEGALNVLGACGRHGVERVLVVGSADEYGSAPPDSPPLTEDAPLRPVTPYGASKVAAEFLALQAHLGGGLGTIRVRSFNHTGPEQADRYLVPGIARQIAEAERRGTGQITVGNLEPVRDFSDVRDVIRAYHLLVTEGSAGAVYNVCSGRGASVSDVVARMVAIADADVSVSVDSGLVRPVDVPWLVGDSSRLRRDTGWEPAHSLDDTLTDVLSYWRAQLTASSR